MIKGDLTLSYGHQMRNVKTKGLLGYDFFI